MRPRQYVGPCVIDIVAGHRGEAGTVTVELLWRQHNICSIVVVAVVLLVEVLLVVILLVVVLIVIVEALVVEVVVVVVVVAEVVEVAVA